MLVLVFDAVAVAAVVTGDPDKGTVVATVVVVIIIIVVIDIVIVIVV